MGAFVGKVGSSIILFFFQGMSVDIERTDSGVGSETSSKGGNSFKSKRAFVLANYNRRGSRSFNEEEEEELEQEEKGFKRCFDCDEWMQINKDDQKT